MKRRLWIGVCTLIFLTCVVTIFWNIELTSDSWIRLKESPELETSFRIRERRRPGRNKLIFFWTRSWSGRERPVAGWDLDETTLEKCEVKCDFTSDRKDLANADALIYHAVSWDARRYYQEKLFNTLPKRDKSNWDQVWTFFRLEPPTSTYQRDFYGFDNIFNWTATYRLDSDVRYPYGLMQRKGTADKVVVDPPLPNEESLRNKSLIGWMNSHCHTKGEREALVAELRKYVPIDIYGDCGELGHLDCVDCYRDMGAKYKFWLSFENTLCLDYVSEKFYQALGGGMVPIVYAHPSLTRTMDLFGLPKSSYIDVSDFKSMAELGAYLLHLGQITEDYLKYSEWRKEFHLRSTISTTNKFWCDYCTKLNDYWENVDNGGERKSYSSIHEWWNIDKETGGPACLEPRKNL